MTSPWIEFRPERRDAQARVLCVPYAGGSAQVYHALARSMPENIEVGAVQLPGRWDRRREPLLTRVSDASRSLADEITRLSPTPYALFGYSLGGLIAFETARILARDAKQQQPRALIVAAIEAPTEKRSRPHLHMLPDAEFIRKQIDRYPGGISPAVLAEPDLLEMLLPILKADMKMFETYQYLPASSTCLSHLRDCRRTRPSYARHLRWLAGKKKRAGRFLPKLSQEITSSSTTQSIACVRRS